MEHLRARRSNEISGGQRQRVALAPPSSCDPRDSYWTSRIRPSTKSCASRCRWELRHLQRAVGITFIEIEIAGFGRAAVKKPPGPRLDGSGITTGADDAVVWR